MSVDLLIERQIARVRMLLNDTGHAVPEDHIRELLKDNYPSQVAEMIHAELHPPKASE
jgi:predicted ABC-type ATPase